MQKVGLIPTARAVRFPPGIVSTGSCGARSKKNIVDFVLGIFPAACIPELYIQMHLSVLFCTGEAKLVFLKKSWDPF